VLVHQRAGTQPARSQNFGMAGGFVTYSGGVPSLRSSFNCSIMDTELGQLTVTFSAAMPDAYYPVSISTEVGAAGSYTQIQSRTTGSFVIQTREPGTNNSRDPIAVSWVVYGL